MFSGEDFLTAKGVTLSREISYGGNQLWVRLFVESYGLVGLKSKNFRGDSEPFLWAMYSFRKMTKSAKYFVDDIDVKDDMFHLRRSRETILTAQKWAELLIKYMPHEQPDNDLLSILYWNMKLLATPSVHYSVPDWRFLWQWIELWGLAPDIAAFYGANNFSREEIYLMTQVSASNADGVTRMFTAPLSIGIRKNIFTVAAKLAAKFLRQI